MPAWARMALFALAALVAWVALVVVGTLEGWGLEPVAPRGDTAAFLAAASARLDAEHAGNAVLLLLEQGEVRGEHAVSVREPVDADSVFQVASLSKWVAAWGVMKLVEDDRLDLDAPVGRYLTRWQLPDGPFGSDGVTVRRLLSHTAGLTDGLGYAGFAPGAPRQSLEESLTRAADASPGASGVVEVGIEPGSTWRYSGGGYTLLQLLVEEASGERFEDYMHRAILAPLDLSHTSFDGPPTGARLATFYDVDSQPAPHYRFTAVAAASLYTSARDLGRFIQAHLPGSAGEPAGRGVLRPETLAAMREPHGTQLGAAIWGLGVILYVPNGAGDFIVGHDGNNEPAINTAARFDPATGDGIVVLETGNPLLATEVAGDWVTWQTGKPDALSLVIGAPQTMRRLAGGAAATLAVVAAWAWLRRRGNA